MPVRSRRIDIVDETFVDAAPALVRGQLDDPAWADQVWPHVQRQVVRDRGLKGVVDPASAYFCKHPRTQMTDDLAHEAVEEFIRAA